MHTYLAPYANVSTPFCTHTHIHTHKRYKPTCSRKGCAIPVLRGVPEAPCVEPKYYTQTVAITSKPEIPHSTFLIPAARLLSWAPHEEPLLEREGSCISLTLRLSVCLSASVSLFLAQPSVSPAPGLSAPNSLSLSCSPSVTPRLSFYFSLCRFAFISLTSSLSPPLCFVAHSPTHFFYRVAFVCVFLCIPRSASSLPPLLFVCGSPSLYKTLTLPPLLLSLHLFLPLCLQIFM